jgi:hypothetical protein
MRLTTSRLLTVRTVLRKVEYHGQVWFEPHEAPPRTASYGLASPSLNGSEGTVQNPQHQGRSA